MFHVNGSRKCEICGEIFNRISYNQRYCGEKCKREASILRSREKRRTEKLNVQTKTKHDTLSEVAARARAAGMSYGQYMLSLKR